MPTLSTISNSGPRKTVSTRLSACSAIRILHQNLGKEAVLDLKKVKTKKGTKALIKNAEKMLRRKAEMAT